MLKDKYIYKKEGVISIEITPSNIEEAVEYIISNNIKSVYFETANKNEFEDYSFFNDINIEELSIINDSVEITKFPLINNIKKIFITNFKGVIDLRKFPELSEATIDWNNKICFEDVSLKKLIIWKYTPKSKTIRELTAIKNLKILQINQTNIISLEAIEELKDLESLEIHYATKLLSIKDLKNLRKLSYLRIDNAKKIEDHSSVKDIISLSKLVFNNCGKIPSISFLNDMKKIQEFRFFGTEIIDGNLLPCLKLKSVSFDNKRHYSHKLKEIN